MQISELKDGMMVAELTVLVVEKRTANAKNGKPYADLVVRDQSGSIKCKWWNYKEEGDSLSAGKVYAIVGQVGSFAGDLQLTLGGYEASDKQPEDFAKNSRFDVDVMVDDIYLAINSFEEPMTKHVALNLITWEMFKKAPAAIKMHNGWYGGLVEHIHSMLSISLPIIQHYQIYAPKLSADKVRFGIIAHDVGKMYEYSYNTPVFGMSPQGLLCNHLVTGPCMIYELCNAWLTEQDDKFDRTAFVQERDHLMHIAASHHGSLEWGSPVVPSTLEAILVHQFDMMDSKFMHALELTEGKEGAVPGFSERSWAEKTSFLLYK